MATMSSVNDNYFTTASETYSDNLSSSIGAAATTVPVNNASVYATGEAVVLTVDPGTANEATFIGKKDTTNQFIECVWTEGNTGVGHDTGATIIDYDSATHHNAQSKGILQFANQDGTLITSAVRASLGLVDESTAGWEVGTIPAPDTVTSNGAGSYDLVFNSTDYTNTVSEGMRIRTTRTVDAPDQSIQLVQSSSQSGIKNSPTGLSFTTTFTCEAWVKLDSYNTGNGIIGRKDSALTGFTFAIRGDGTLEIIGLRASGNYKTLISSSSVPLNKWVHVAATLDMSVGDTSAQKMWFDGVEVPRGYSLVGTGTTLTQGTSPLVVGARETIAGVANTLMDGKLQDVRVWSDLRSEAEIRANMSQYPSDTSNLVAHFKLDGDWTDSSSNGNDATASGGPSFASDAPHGNSGVSTTLDYGIITAKSFSTNTTLTVQVPKGCTIPTSGGITAFAYSLVDTPFGFPRDKGKWLVETIYRGNDSQTTPTNGVWYNLANLKLTVPVGEWKVEFSTTYGGYLTSSKSYTAYSVLSTAAATAGDKDMQTWINSESPTTGINAGRATHGRHKYYSHTTPTAYYLNYLSDTTAQTIQVYGTAANTVIRAECAYL